MYAQSQQNMSNLKSTDAIKAKVELQKWMMPMPNSKLNYLYNANKKLSQQQQVRGRSQPRYNNNCDDPEQQSLLKKNNDQNIYSHQNYNPVVQQQQLQAPQDLLDYVQQIKNNSLNTSPDSNQSPNNANECQNNSKFDQRNMRYVNTSSLSNSCESSPNPKQQQNQLTLAQRFLSKNELLNYAKNNSISEQFAHNLYVRIVFIAILVFFCAFSIILLSEGTFQAKQSQMKANDIDGSAQQFASDSGSSIITSNLTVESKPSNSSEEQFKNVEKDQQNLLGIIKERKYNQKQTLDNSGLLKIEDTMTNRLINPMRKQIELENAQKEPKFVDKLVNNTLPQNSTQPQ
eukprot:403356972